MLLDAADDCVLFIVDIQARLAPAISGADEVIARTAILLAAAARLGVPVVASEQYPQGLGHTDARLALPEGAPTFAKLAFSAAARARDRRPSARASAGARSCCAGWRPMSACSRPRSVCGHSAMTSPSPPTPWARATPSAASSASSGCATQGVAIVDSEMVVFEWLGAAGTPQFKELSRLIR